MKRHYLRLVAVLAAIAPVGCKRGGGERPASTRPAATVAESAAAVPGETRWTIDGREFVLPGGRVRLDERDDQVVVQLFGDSADPAADGYYLEMGLDIPDVGELDGATWQHSPEERDPDDREETPNVVRVEAGAAELQPREVTATFRVVSDSVVEVRVNGFFNVFAGRDAGVATRQVAVSATVVARRER